MRKIFNIIIIIFISYLSFKYLIKLSSELSIQIVLNSLKSLNLTLLVAALSLTFLNYFIIIFYDISVSNQLNLNIPLKHLSVISLITFIINNNLGFGAFLGGALRFRFLSRLNVNLKNITKYLIIFSWVYWVGLIFLSSITFLLITPDTTINLPFSTIYIKGFWIGFFSIISLGIFFLISLIKDIFQLNYKILAPIATTKRLTIITLISTIDWLLLSYIVYILLPHSNLLFLNFLPKFLIAQIGAVTSHVPAGIGVFDSIMIYYFKDITGLNSLVSSLIIFRVVYFILPMIIGVSMFLLYELHWSNKLTLERKRYD